MLEAAITVSLAKDVNWVAANVAPRVAPTVLSLLTKLVMPPVDFLILSSNPLRLFCAWANPAFKSFTSAESLIKIGGITSAILTPHFFFN